MHTGSLNTWAAWSTVVAVAVALWEVGVKAQALTRLYGSRHGLRDPYVVDMLKAVQNDPEAATKTVEEKVTGNAYRARQLARLFDGEYVTGATVQRGIGSNTPQFTFDGELKLTPKGREALAARR